MKSDWDSRRACEGSASEPPGQRDRKTLACHKCISWSFQWTEQARWIQIGFCCDTYPRHDDLLNVIEDILPVLRLRRCSLRKKLPHVARFHIRNDPPLPDGAQVLCDVVHHLLTWSVRDHCKLFIFIFFIMCLLAFEVKYQHHPKWVHDYLCDCIPQLAFSEMRPLRVTLSCVTGDCSEALCIWEQRLHHYIDPVVKNTPQIGDAFEPQGKCLSCIFFHHWLHICTKYLLSSCSRGSFSYPREMIQD